MITVTSVEAQNRFGELLDAAQEARRKMKKEEGDKIKWNVSAEVFQPAGEKGEAEKNQGGEGVQQN